MRTYGKLLLIGLTALGAAEIFLRNPSRGAPPAGAAAPGFTLSDVDGRQFSLASLRGKVVALNFWASWCPPCRAEIPELVELYRSHRDACFELLGIAEDSGSREQVTEAARQFGIDYPVLVDPRGAVGDAYRIPGFPRTYLIDREGKIRKIFDGAIDRSEFEGELAPLLAEASGSCPRAASPRRN